MFHTLAYTASLGVNAVNTDFTAATDPEFSQRNGHYIFTEQYELLAACYLATSALRASYQVPYLNQYTRYNIWPVNRSLNTPSNPQHDWYMPLPVGVPQNEEFQVQGSNNLGAGTEQSTAFLWIAPMGKWNRNLPPALNKGDKLGPIPPLEVRLNFTTPALTANAWSGLGAVTFEQSLRGGTYAVVGCEAQGAAVNAMRFVFPRAPIYSNRRMRPGIIVNQAVGDITPKYDPYQQYMWGEFGRFSTFEPPQVEWWANTAGAVAVEVRLWLVYLSEDMNVQY